MISDASITSSQDSFSYSNQHTMANPSAPVAPMAAMSASQAYHANAVQTFIQNHPGLTQQAINEVINRNNTMRDFAGAEHFMLYEQGDQRIMELRMGLPPKGTSATKSAPQ